MMLSEVKMAINNNLKQTEGMAWHVHHDILVEYLYDYDRRVEYIKSRKPKNEVETRLRLMQFVKGKLSKEVIEARKGLDKAVKEWDINYFHESVKEWVEARKGWGETWKKYSTEIEALHKEECNCKEWDGKKLVFEKWQ